VACCDAPLNLPHTHAGRSELEHLLSQSDVVSLHCQLTDATRGLIAGPELALMKRGAVLINTARGHVLDKAALLAALAAPDCRLAGVGLDVGWDEPDDPQDELYRWGCGRSTGPTAS
jgi:phosphoglycerate dehydrogenase-like enzyme